MVPRLRKRHGPPTDPQVSPRATRNESIHDALRVHGYTLQGVGDVVGLHDSAVS